MLRDACEYVYVVSYLGIESNNYVGALDGFAGGMSQQAPHLVNPSFVNI